MPEIPTQRFDNPEVSKSSEALTSQHPDNSKRQPQHQTIISLIEEKGVESENDIEVDTDKMEMESFKSSWNIYTDQLTNLLMAKEEISTNDAQVKAQNMLFWPNIGFYYADVHQLYFQSIRTSDMSYKKVGNILWDIANDQRAELKFTGSISQSVNSLLTFIELQVWKEVNLNFNTNNETSETLSQVDGGNDSEEDLKSIPPCLGNLECSDENLYHIATLFRGFECVWAKCCNHDLCDHTKKNSNGRTCYLCLSRSFTYRVNDMRLKGGKRTLKPVEILSEIKSFRESNSDHTLTLETELWILLTEISDQLQINLISDFQISAKQCGKVTNFRSFIESSLELEETETLSMFLE